jgi:hypothetical protein
VIPVAFPVEVIMSGDIMVMVPMPLVAARVVVVVACVVPKVPATVMAVTVDAMVIATSVAPAVVATVPTAVRIADVNVNRSRAKVYPLGKRLVGFTSHSPGDNDCRSQQLYASHTSIPSEFWRLRALWSWFINFAKVMPKRIKRQFLPIFK